jgi:hypothetical protein
MSIGVRYTAWQLNGRAARDLPADMHVPQGRWLAVNATPERQIWRGDLRAAVARLDQRTLCTR